MIYIFIGVTEIAHQHSDSVSVDQCKGTECFRMDLNYGNVSVEQAQALIRISETCRQYFKVKEDFSRDLIRF